MFSVTCFNPTLLQYAFALLQPCGVAWDALPKQKWKIKLCSTGSLTASICYYVRTLLSLQALKLQTSSDRSLFKSQVQEEGLFGCLWLRSSFRTHNMLSEAEQLLDLGRRFAAALLPRLFGKNPRSHHKGATSRVQTGNQLLPVLCPCQLGQDIPNLLLTYSTWRCCIIFLVSF